MISLQEVLSKTEKQRRRVRDALDKGTGFHPEDASIYADQNLADYHAIKETLRSISIRQLIEFLGRGQTLGDYLVADKVHDDLVFYASQTDIAPLVSAQVVYGWQGSDLIVNVVDDESYKPNFTVGGASAPSGTVKAEKCTLTPKTFTVNMPIGMDLEEDTGYALVDYHIDQAAKAVGDLSTHMVLDVLITAPDGVGTLNTLAAGADETTYANVLNCLSLNGDDEFISDTMITTLESWRHSIGQTAAGIPGTMAPPPPPGFHIQLQQLSVRFCCDPLMHLATDVAGAVMTDCKTLVFDKKAAVLTGRKRWMQLENYVDPVRDIAGAVVSCRQDSVSLYKDSICYMKEA